MSKIKDFLSNHTQVALSIPAVLCCIQFLSSVFGAFRTGVFNSDTLNQLLSTADGFESVVLFIIMLALKTKKK